MSCSGEKLHKVKHIKRQSTSHIEWSPLEDSKFAIASHTGDFSIYDMDHIIRQFKKKPYLQLRHHTIAVNKVSWNPYNANMIVTAGHDCILNIWDLRNKQPTDFIHQA